MILSRFLCLIALTAGIVPAAGLTVLPDYVRLHPDGSVVEQDRGPGVAPASEISLTGARASYVSCQLIVTGTGAYRLHLAPFAGIQADTFREWFHLLSANKTYIPDALVPVQLPYGSSIPDPDNRIAGQKVQVFWVDLWIPDQAAPGNYSSTATLEAEGRSVEVAIRVTVIPATVPKNDAVLVDHNSYGTSWFAAQYPKLAGASDDYKLLHAYHRLIDEHHGTFHQLGYGHAGKVGPEFAPRLTGSGKTKHIADWTDYDRHYGPLFDGSAYAGGRRGAHPIPFVYLPVNPEWPASFLLWGEPGYEREFVNVMSEMEKHFRQKGWTNTRLELFFNHKKRYKGFPWDGDEARFPRDYAYMREYARLMKLAVPGDSPVKFVFRADVSWTMERQFRELKGIVNLWVCGGGMFSWYPEAVRQLKERGDTVWIYGGTPPVTEASSHITTDVLRPWIYGVDGFVRWQTTQPGSDPWFKFEGGGEALVYPGDRFGIAGPIPSLRLKIQRNAIQDLTLLNSFAPKRAMAELRSEAARRYNGTTVEEWWNPRPALADTDPLEWTNATIEDAIPPKPKFTNIDAGAWQRVQDYIMELGREAQ